MKWLKSFLEVEENVGSSVRLVFFLSFLFLIGLPIVVWAWLSIINGELMPIDTTVIDFCKWGFAAATAGKVVQAFKEN